MSYLKIFVFIITVSLYGCGGSDQEKAHKFTVSGQKHLTNNNITAAKIEFTNALRLDKNSQEALYEMALIMESEKDWRQFEENLKRLLELAPDHIDARLRLTNFYMGSGQLKLALPHSDHLKKIAPDNINVNLTEAAILYKTNRTEEARSLIDTILKKEPENIDAIFLRANDFIQASEFRSALTLIDRGLSKQQDNLVLNMTKIQVLTQINDWEAAVPVYHHLMDLYPQNTAPPAALARGYAAQGDINKAISVLETFANKNQNADFFIKAIEIIHAEEGLQATEKKLNTYIDNNQNMHSLKFALADIYTQTQRIGLAREAIEKIKISSTDKTVTLEAMNRLAKIDISIGDTNSAKRLVSKVLKQDPKNTSAQAIQANLLINDNKAKEAIKILRSGLRDAPESPELLMTLGRAHEQEQQWELANDSYANAIKYSTGSSLQIIHYADFLVNRGNLTKAEKLLAPLVNSKIQNEKALKLYSHIMLTKNQWDKANQVSDQLRSLQGDSTEAAHLKGLALSGKGDTKGALEAYQHLYDLSPSAQSSALLVQAFIADGKKEDAKKFLDEIIEKDKNNFHGYYLKGNMYSHFKNWSEAEQAYQKAVNNDSSQLEGHDRLIKLQLQTLQLDKAKASIEKALTIFPGNISLNIFHAELYKKLNQKHKSIEIYQTILNNRPELDVIANNLAVLLTISGDQESLKRAATVADRFRQSKVPAYKDTLGWIYALQGNLDEAIALLRRASERLEGEPEIEYHLGAAYHFAKNEKMAEKWLTRAIENADNKKITASWVDDAKKLLAE